MAETQVHQPLGASYQLVCEQRDIPPDRALLKLLNDRSPVIYLRSEPHITTLIHLLTTIPSQVADYVPTELFIQAPYIPAATIGTLASYLTIQTHLTHLTITKTKLPDAAAETILTALITSTAPNSPLTHINLSDVGLTEKSAKAIAPILKKNQLGSLSDLNLSNNTLNFSGVQLLKNANQYRISEDEDSKINMNLSGNLVLVETLNTVTHGLGALIALLGGILLTVQAYYRNHSSSTILSIAIFCLSLFTLLSSSCAYHSMFRYPKMHALLRRFDHCSIFLLIAGSYTPFLVVYALDPPTWNGRFTLMAVWSFASIGFVKSLMGTSSNKGRAFFALVTGWLGVLSFKTLIDRMQHEAVVLTVIGGVVYSVGIIFYLIGKKLPIYHVVWHFAVLIAGTLHYLVISRYIVYGVTSDDVSQ